MKSINAKLTIIQTQLKATKSRYNQFGGYNYRSAEDITTSLKPLLVANQCNLVTSEDIKLIGERVYVVCISTLTCSETGEQISANGFARETLSRKGMDDSQLTGATASYAKKYALGNLLCIDDTQDFDSMNNQQYQTPTQEKPVMTEDSKSFDRAVKHFHSHKSLELVRQHMTIPDAVVEKIIKASAQYGKALLAEKEEAVRSIVEEESKAKAEVVA